MVQPGVLILEPSFIESVLEVLLLFCASLSLCVSGEAAQRGGLQNRYSAVRTRPDAYRSF